MLNTDERELVSAEQRLTAAGSLSEQSGNGMTESIGLEVESFLLLGKDCEHQRRGDSPLPLDFDNSRVVALTGDQRFAVEIAGCGLEGRTLAYHRGTGQPLFRTYLGAALELRRAKYRLAEAAGIRLLGAASVPFTTELLGAYMEWICPQDRFKLMVERQNAESYGPFPYRAQLPTLGGQTEVEVPMSSAMYALAGQHSLNVGFSYDSVGFGANMFMALMPVAAIFSNSRAAGSGIGKWHWNRLQYAMAGMGPQGRLLRFSNGRYYRNRGEAALIEWLRHCMERELLVGADEQGLKCCGSVTWPHLRARVGQAWTLGPRLAWLDGPNETLSVWLESNAVDAQPTWTEGLALDLLLIGNVCYWHKMGLDDFSQLIPCEDIEPTTWQIAKAGPYDPQSTIRWHGEVYRADTWVLDRLIPDALAGIDIDGICDSETADALLSVLERALRKQCTGSDWTRRRAERYHDSGRNEQEAICRSLLDLAKLQSEIVEDESEFCGLVDYV